MKRTSLSKWLIGYLILFSAAIALVITVIQLYFEYGRDATLENVYQQLYSRAWLVLITNGIEIALVALIFYMLFAHLVSRHLEKISRYLSQNSNHAPNTPLFLDRESTSRSDELDMLVSGINNIYENQESPPRDLYESEEHVRLLLESTGEAIYGIDLNGSCTFANPACARITGFDSVDEFLSLDIHQTIHHTHSDGSPYPFDECQINRALIKGEQIHVDDEIFWRKDGSSFPVEYWSYPIYREGNNIGSVVTFNDITERKQAENLLREASELNEKIIGEAPIGMSIYDSKGHCIVANKAYAEMVGGTQEQLLEQETYKNLESWKNSGLIDVANESISQQQKVRSEFEFLSTFGKHAIYDGFFMPITARGEQHLLFMLDDISERRQIQAELDDHRNQLEEMVDERTNELKQARDELLLIIDTFNGYIYRDVIDVVSHESDKTIYMTKGVEKLTGYSADEFVGKERKSQPELILPEDGEMVWAKVREGVRTHQEFESNHRIRTRDGEERWIYERGHGVYDQNGVPLYVEGYIMDDHLRKKAESELDKYRLHLEQLVDERTSELKQAQDELVLVVDTLNGYVYRDAVDEISNLGVETENPIYMTNGVEKLTGYSADELTRNGGKTFPDLIIPEDREMVWTRIKEAVSAHEEFEINYRIRTRGGEERWVYERGHGIYDQNGEPRHIDGYVIDDHERRKAETELDKYRGHLEQLVEERTRELSEVQDELVRKGRLATLGQLTATVSHELRNPMGALRASLHTIKKRASGKPDDKLIKTFQRAERSIDRCDRIIDELLGFSRITRLEKESTRIDEWIESILDEQDIFQGIQVIKRPGLNKFELPIDTNRLRRGFINVLENACQSMQDQSGTVRQGSQLIIETRIRDGRIEITIADTGTGISEDLLTKIFEPLFSTKNFGVGLGMPIVKQIMEQHEGGVEVDSEEGKGTTVILWLPRTVDGEGLAKQANQVQ